VILANEALGNRLDFSQTPHPAAGLREQVNPGHGVVQIVEPVAEKIEMRVAI
jgi:hypothetical protein